MPKFRTLLERLALLAVLLLAAFALTTLVSAAIQSLTCAADAQPAPVMTPKSTDDYACLAVRIVAMDSVRHRLLIEATGRALPDSVGYTDVPTFPSGIFCTGRPQ